MPFRMRRRMLAPISSIKHIHQRTNLFVTSGTSVSEVIVDAVAKGGTRSLTSTVEEGCVIKAIHLEFWLCSTDTVTSQFTFIIYKLPSG